MKKISLIIAFLICFVTHNACSQITEQKTNAYLKILTTSYPDYAPISYIEGDYAYTRLVSIFSQALNDVLKSNNIDTLYESSRDYEQNIEKSRSGLYDIVMGVYNETQNGPKNFEHLEYIFPAILQNPVSLVMLNGKQSTISSYEDLKKLKGIYISQEYFSDYVLERFSDLNITSVDTIKDAYEKLFLGQVDYIVGSYYYQYVAAIQNGVKNYLSFSKKPIWHMPMFIGISKNSKNFNRLKILLSKQITNSNFTQKVKEELKNQVKIFEQKNIGLVPPGFILEQNSKTSTIEEKTTDKDN